MTMKIATPGFSAIELLITLFIAATFITSGYTLYSVITRDSAEARNNARLGNVAKDYLDRYRVSAGTCTPSSPVQSKPITVTGVTDATISVTISCPNPAVPTVTRVSTIILYNKPQKTFELAGYGVAQ